MDDSEEAKRFEELMQMQTQMVPLRRKSTLIVRVELKDDEESNCCHHEEPMKNPESQRLPECARPHSDEANKNLSRSEAVRIGKEECLANMNQMLQEYYLK